MGEAPSDAVASGFFEADDQSLSAAVHGSVVNGSTSVMRVSNGGYSSG